MNAPIMKKDKLSKYQPRYYVEETPDRFIVHKYEKRQPRISLTISSSWWILLFAIVGFIVISVHNNANHEDSGRGTFDSDKIESEFADGENLLSSSSFNWEETGFIFVNSDFELITEEQIHKASEQFNIPESEVIQYAINELYARHHYRFNNTRWAEFYGQFDWYCGTLSIEDARNEFNGVEIENLLILTRLRKLYK